MDRQDLVAATGSMDADELADLAPDLPPDVVAEVQKGLTEEERARLLEAMGYPRTASGHHGLRNGPGARGRVAGGGVALPAPPARTARPHRPDFRGRPPGQAARRPADRHAAGQRARYRSARGHELGFPDPGPAGFRRRRRQRVRTLRSGLGPGHRRTGPADRPRHHCRRGGRDPGRLAGAGAVARRPAGRRHLRARAHGLAQPRPWLLFNLCTAATASFVASRFEDTVSPS